MNGAFRKAGDGLSDKMKFDPQLHEPGDEVFHIMRSIVGPHTFTPVALLPSSPFDVTENYVVQEAVEVDGEDIRAYMTTAKQAIEAAKAQQAEEEALANGTGIPQTLDTDGPVGGGDNSGTDAEEPASDLVNA
ncbi:MAG TPA: hypothetical protein VF244_11000 [Acidimicrobiales bacterium]